jgi:hypothetical protein
MASFLTGLLNSYCELKMEAQEAELRAMEKKVQLAIVRWEILEHFANVQNDLEQE